VPLTVPLAGLGERALAYAIDLAVLLAALLALLFVYNFWGDLEADLSGLGTAGLLVLLAAALVLLLGYDVLCEVAFAGRTPGKRLMKLRVLAASGRPPDALRSLLRNALRLVDFLPVFYGVGTVALFVTGTRRLGDLLADTFVLSERAREQSPLAACAKAAEGTSATEAPGWSDEQVLLALAMVQRTAELPRAAADKLCARVLARLEPEAAPAPSPRAALAAGCLALSCRPGGLAAQLARMDTAQRALHDALGRVKRAPSHAAVERLDDALRRAGSELMQGTRKRAPMGSLEGLSLALLDADRGRGAPRGRKGLLAFFARDVPAAVWQERVLVLRAGAVLLLSSLLGFGLCYADPVLGRALVGEDLAGAIEDGARWTDRIAESGAFAATALRLILNNGWVCLVAFVSGLLGGALPLLVLFGNGIHLGSVFGYATRLGTADTLARFILAHGPVELSAICVAAAGGLCLGRSLLAPGRRSRLEALREEADVGARLFLAAIFGIAVIGTVEGFVSSGAFLPWYGSLFIGLGLFGLFAAWARLLGAPAAALAAARKSE
jgi:uncharacterized membrane protein SpoIIM required for sporulation/uncharacterized RDD family membrane protein YckC